MLRLLLATAAAGAAPAAESLEQTLDGLRPVLFLAQTLEAKHLDKVTGQPVVEAAAAGEFMGRAYDKLKVALTEAQAEKQAEDDGQGAGAAAAQAVLARAQQDFATAGSTWTAPRPSRTRSSASSPR